MVSALGQGVDDTVRALKEGRCGLTPLTHFTPPHHTPMLVGEVPKRWELDGLPRTHRLARLAADEAMEEGGGVPDAIVMGVTTGGMPTSEVYLMAGENDPALFRHHAVSTVAEDLARRYHCQGPVVTVSTACSSGAVAIVIALEMLRSGMASRVLAGGADALCRLTYYGFQSLQLIDPHGARPLDVNRRGMSVAEGAAALLLETVTHEKDTLEVLGAGLSCDAFHPTRPHPGGDGALAAMISAVRDANIETADIDYVNLHGTGTLDNDLSEAKALGRLFGNEFPFLSSVKGATGHSLAAAGAVEAVISVLCMKSHIVPANVGCLVPDPALGFQPTPQPLRRPIETVLSNSFGFGGNNAALVFGRSRKATFDLGSSSIPTMGVYGWAAITGAGKTIETLEQLERGGPCHGMIADEELVKGLPRGTIRRLKRLPRMALALASDARQRAGDSRNAAAIFCGTAWGSLSETGSFLERLVSTDEQFPSPTDFIGSVHNAAAGQIALQLQAKGANVTTSGGDYSFEQALLTSGLLTKDDAPFLVLAVDEAHGHLSSLFDPSVRLSKVLSDGGGSLWLSRDTSLCGPTIRLMGYEHAAQNPNAVARIVRLLGEPRRIREKYGLILTGMPAVCRNECNKQLKTFLAETGFNGPVLDYRLFWGEFPAASAVAAALAAAFVNLGTTPAGLCPDAKVSFKNKGILILGFGPFVTAMEALPT